MMFGDRIRLRTAAEHISAAMTWAYTSEGAEYWRYVHSRLLQYSNPTEATVQIGPKALRAPSSEGVSIDRKHVLETAAKIISENLNWNQTSEGYDWWNEVHNRCRVKAGTAQSAASRNRKLLLLEDEERRSENGLNT